MISLKPEYAISVPPVKGPALYKESPFIQNTESCPHAIGISWNRFNVILSCSTVKFLFSISYAYRQGAARVLLMPLEIYKILSLAASLDLPPTVRILAGIASLVKPFIYIWLKL